MTQFFEKRDPWGHGMALWVLVAMVFVAPLAWWSVRQIKLENDVASWLPSDDPHARILNWYRGHFSVEDRILVSWEGSALDDPRVARFARRLQGTPDADGLNRGGLKFVERVVTPHQLIAQMEKRGIGRDEAIRRLQGVLVGKGRLKIQLTEAGRRRKRQTIRLLKIRAKSELGLELEMPARPARTEPANFDEEAAGADDLEVELESFAITRPYDFQIGWRGMHGRPQQVDQVMEVLRSLRGRRTPNKPEGDPLVVEGFFTPSSPVALSVTFSDAGSADTKTALVAIRQVAADVGIDRDHLHMGGRGVAGSALNQEVKKAAWNRGFSLHQIHKRSPLLLSGLVSIGLAFLMLRSFRMATLVLIVTFYTTLLSVALVPVTGGSMNMVLVVMPTLLLVLTLSAAIHVANYWKHAAHQNRQTAVVEATTMARQPCALASMTTAIGLLSLATSPLAPVRDFGLYAAIGCLLALLLVLYALPALLQFWPARPPAQAEVDRTVWRRLGAFLSRYCTAVTVASLAALAVCAYGLYDFRTETKVIRYFPQDALIMRNYNFLEENLAGIVPVEMIVRFDKREQRRLNFLERLEVVRQIQDRMRQHPEISGAISLADFQPVYKPLPESATRIQRMLRNKKVKQTEQRVKAENAAARAFLTLSSQTADLHESGEKRLSDPGDELWRISAQVAILSDLNYGDLTRDVDEIAKSVLKYHAGAGHVVTGMVPLFLRTQQAVLDSLIWSFGLAFCVIAVVMVFLLRNPLSGLITMLPNLLPVGMVFGLISWNGVAVDIGTMITASVALGIAVDGTLHLLTWFRVGIIQGMSRAEAVSHALVHAGPALWQTSTAVGLGLLMLLPAELLLVSRFGWLMASLIGTALMADIIFLPALLAGPLGILIEKTVAQEAAARLRNAESEGSTGEQAGRDSAPENPQSAIRNGPNDPDVGPRKPHLSVIESAKVEG